MSDTKKKESIVVVGNDLTADKLARLLENADDLRDFDAILVTREWLDEQARDITDDVYKHALEQLVSADAAGLNLYFIRANYQGRALAYYQTLIKRTVEDSRLPVENVLRPIVLAWCEKNYNADL